MHSLRKLCINWKIMYSFCDFLIWLLITNSSVLCNYKSYCTRGESITSLVPRYGATRLHLRHSWRDWFTTRAVILQLHTPSECVIILIYCCCLLFRICIFYWPWKCIYVDTVTLTLNRIHVVAICVLYR